VTEGFYVQVRYPQGQRWMTVAVSDHRPTASTAAAEAYRDLRNARGDAPRQVRVISATQFVRESGRRAVKSADAELVKRAERLG